METMDLDGCIFGWVLFKDIDIPIAHHVGIILEWNGADPMNSIVVHYGSDCTGRVLLETMRDAVVRSDVRVVKINPHYRASFNHTPYYVEEDGSLRLGVEMVKFQEEHPVYDVIACNCQHFIRTFIQGIPIESDVMDYIHPIVRNMMHNIILGSTNDIHTALSSIRDSYHTYRSRGICAWDDALDISVSRYM